MFNNFFYQFIFIDKVCRLRALISYAIYFSDYEGKFFVGTLSFINEGKKI